MRRFLLGAVVGLVAGGAIALIAVGVVYARKRHDLWLGWNLHRIVVAGKDLPEGTKLDADSLEYQELPEQYALGSLVSVDSAGYLDGRELAVPVAAGDPITWQAVVRAPWESKATACAERIREDVARAAADARAAVMAKVRAAVEAAPTAAPKLPFSRNPDGSVDALVVKEDLNEGAAISASDVKRVRYPAALSTMSVVPASELEAVVGATVTAPILKGDALRWQFLSKAGAPMSSKACVSLMADAVSQAEAKTAEEKARSFLSELK